MRNIIIPTLDCPFPPAINPYVKVSQQHNLEWAQRLRLVAPADSQHFYAANVAGLAARTYPNAPCEELMIVADWSPWLFLQDDDCDEASVGAYLDANIWDATNRQARRTPDVATYLAKRPFTGAIYPCLDLIDLTEGI